MVVIGQQYEKEEEADGGSAAEFLKKMRVPGAQKCVLRFKSKLLHLVTVLENHVALDINCA